MYKLMVVDDEQIVLDAVKFIVTKNLDNVEVIETARSGREAIEKVRVNKPDIMIMDIRMPGINGLETISEIKHIYKDIKFIIVSAYEQFEFAKQAVEVGVEEYILKPINRYKLIDVLNKITNDLNDDKRKRDRELQNIEKLDKVIPMLEEGFIYSILMNRDFKDEFQKYKELFNVEDDGGYIMIVQFGDGEQASQLTNKIGAGIKGHSFYPYFRDILKYKCKCIIGPVMINRIIVFVTQKERSSEYENRLESTELATYIINKLNRNTDVKFFVGIGSYKKYDKITFSYSEAIKALRYNKGEDYTHIMDIVEGKKIDSEEANQEIYLIEKLKQGNDIAVLKYMQNIIDLARESGGDITGTIRNKLIEIMVIAHKTAKNMGVKEDNQIKYDKYLNQMLGIHDLMQLSMWCNNIVKYLAIKIKELKEGKVSKVIVDAKKFIETNYSKEITLEEVAKNVSISPQYFSKLFKEETGDNFIEYLTKVRIEQGKNLLKNTNYSVKEICYKIGYSDPNYFSRLFKKNVGVSPTEYFKKM